MTRPTTRPARADVRHALIEAASKEFAAHGYQNASLAAIARHAGFTKGAIYSNFESKPELFVAVCEYRLVNDGSDIIDTVAKLLETYDDKETLLAKMSEAFTHTVLDKGAWQVTLSEFRALALHDEKIAEVYGSWLAHRRDRLVGYLKRNALTKDRPVDELEGIALVALSLYNTFSVEHLAAPDVVTGETITQTLAQAMEGML